MKKVFPVLLTCLIMAFSCKPEKVMKINGRVDNPVFNGSKAYITGSTPKGIVREDSATVSEGKFSFTVPVDTLIIKSIVIPVKENQAVQEMIFISEPGTLDVLMSAESKSAGTRLNRILMNWRKDNFRYDSTQYELYYQSGMPGIPPEVRDSLVQISAKLDSSYMKKSIALMNNNLENGIGLLLFKFYYEHLPVETRKNVLEKKGKLYLEKDWNLLSKVMFDTEVQK